MKIMKRLLPALLLAAAACAHVPAPNAFKADPEPLEADGSAELDVRDLASSKARAVLDAQRAAVRRAAELFLDEDAGGERPQVLENGPLRSPQLYVARHKVLAEGPDGASYRVTLKVWVYHDKIAAALRGLALSGPARKRAALAQAAPSAAFSAAFKAAFARRSAMDVEDLPAGYAGPEEAARAASAAGDDLLFYASASAAASAAGLNTGFFPSRGEASLLVLEPATGRELLRLSSQASSVDSSQQAADAKALAAAGEALAQEAAVKTARLVKSDPVVRVRVSGLSGLEELEKLKAQLQSLDVKSLRLESYAEGVAVFEVSPRTSDVQEFASTVLRGDSMGLELEGAGAQEAAFALPR